MKDDQAFELFADQLAADARAQLHAALDRIAVRGRIDRAMTDIRQATNCSVDVVVDLGRSMVVRLIDDDDPDADDQVMVIDPARF